MGYQVYQYLELVAGALVAGIILSIAAHVVFGGRAMTCALTIYVAASLGACAGLMLAALLHVGGRP